MRRRFLGLAETVLPQGRQSQLLTRLRDLLAGAPSDARGLKLRNSLQFGYIRSLKHPSPKAAPISKLSKSRKMPQPEKVSIAGSTMAQPSQDGVQVSSRYVDGFICDGAIT